MTRVAEFFAGIGLVRAAVEQAGLEVVYANDISPSKRAMYAASFDASHFVLGDVRDVVGSDLPAFDLATASFPCTDLSLAGDRAGLAGPRSGTLWSFVRILRERGPDAPRALLIENVLGFASSHGGSDLAAAISALNELGYSVDALVIDACHFVPQSRPRLFLIGLRGPSTAYRESSHRPEWLVSQLNAHPGLRLHGWELPELPTLERSFDSVAERFASGHECWWEAERITSFRASLSALNRQRLEQLARSPERTWRTAYRRTRNGRATWEIRGDGLAGCLRTPRGGSSRQAVVEGGRGGVRVRWMTPRECARLQGAPDFPLGSVSESAAIFGFGDAVCVPVVAWLARHYLSPLLDAARTLTDAADERGGR